MFSVESLHGVFLVLYCIIKYCLLCLMHVVVLVRIRYIFILLRPAHQILPMKRMKHQVHYIVYTLGKGMLIPSLSTRW